MSANAFLKEFIKMRQEVKAAVPTSSPGMSGKQKHTKKQEVIEGGVNHIIEKKPPKREVMEYLQEKANSLTIEKMR
jgi:hypothetical protein